MTEQDGIAVIDRCMASMRDRFLITQTSFTVKIIKKDGIRTLRAP